MSDPLPMPSTETNIVENKQDASLKTPEKLLANMKLSRSLTNGSPTIIPLMKLTDPHLRRSMTSYNYTPNKKFEINSKVSSNPLPHKTDQKTPSSLLSAQSLASSSSFSFSSSNDNLYRSSESFKKRKINNSNNDNSNSDNSDNNDNRITSISDPICPQPKLSNQALLAMLKSNSFLKKRSQENHNALLNKVPPARNDQNAQTDDKIRPQTINIPTTITTIINSNSFHEYNEKKNLTDDNKNTAIKDKKSSIEDNIKISTDPQSHKNLLLPLKDSHETENENNILTPEKNISLENLSVKNRSKETPSSSKDLNTLPVLIKIPILNKNGKITPHKPIKTPTTLSPNFLLSNSKNKLRPKVDTHNKSITKEQSKLPETNSLDNTINRSQNKEKTNFLVFKATPTKNDDNKTSYAKQETFQYSSNNANMFIPTFREGEASDNDKDNTAPLSQVHITPPHENELGLTSPVKNIKDNNRENNDVNSNEEQADIENSSSKNTIHNTSQKIIMTNITPEKGIQISEQTQNASQNVKVTIPHDKDTFTSSIDENNDENSSQLVRNNQNASFYDNVNDKSSISIDIPHTSHTQHNPSSKSHISTTNTSGINITINTDKIKTDIQNPQIKSTEATTDNKNQVSNLENQAVEEQNVSNVEENEKFFHLDNAFSPSSSGEPPYIQKSEPNRNIINNNLDKSKNQDVEAPKMATTVSNDLLDSNDDSFVHADISSSLKNKSDGVEKVETLKPKISLKRKSKSNDTSAEEKRNKKTKVTSTSLQKNSPGPKSALDLKKLDVLLDSKKSEPIALRNNSQTVISNKKTPKNKWRQFLDDSPSTSVIAQSSLLSTLSDIYNTSKKEYNTLTSLGDSINVYNMHRSSNSIVSSNQKLSHSDQKETENYAKNLKTSVVDITPEMKIECFDELNILPIANSMKMEIIYISDSESDNEDKNISKTRDKISPDDGSNVEIFDKKYNSTQISKDVASSPFLHDIDLHTERKKFEYGFTTLAYNKLKNKSSIPKNTITDLICDGITKYTPLKKSNTVSVSNDICSSDNFQFSHTAFYQQLHKRDRIHYISIDSDINTSYLKGKYTILPPINETKTVENEHILFPGNNKKDSNGENNRNKHSKEVSVSNSKSSATALNTDRMTPSSNTTQTSMYEEEIVTENKSKDHQTNILNSAPSIGNGVKSSKEIWIQEWLINLESSTVYFRSDNLFDNKMEQVKYVFTELFKCVPSVLLNSTVDIIILGKKESSSESDQNAILKKYRFIMKKLSPGKKIRIWTYEKALKFIQDMGIDMKTIPRNNSIIPSELTATKVDRTTINNNIVIYPENTDELIKSATQNESTKITEKQPNTMQIINNKVGPSKNNSNTTDTANLDRRDSTDSINKNSDTQINLSETTFQQSLTKNAEIINTKHEKENQELTNRKEGVSFSQPTNEGLLPKESNKFNINSKWLEPKHTDLLSALESGQKEIDNLQFSSTNHSIFKIVNLMVNSLDKAADIINMKSQELQTANCTIKALCSQILQQQYELASLHAVVEAQKKRLAEGEEMRKEITIKWMQAIIKNQTLESLNGEDRENLIS